VDAARLGDLEVRAASVVGPDHRCAEPAKPRQDAYALSRTAAGHHLIVAVADGVSECRRSDVGARIAVSAAVREIRRALDGGTALAELDHAEIFTAAAREMAGTARSRGWDDADVSAVMVVAVVPAMPAADGGRLIWAASVGDSSVWRRRGRYWELCLGDEKEGLDRNAVKTLLPFTPAAGRAQRLRVEPGQPVAVVTDGLGDVLTDVAGAQEHFAAAWSCPPGVVGFLADLCFDAVGQLDDRTAVVVWCGEPAARSGGTRP
jgi:hypothetical protein